MGDIRFALVRALSIFGLISLVAALPSFAGESDDCASLLTDAIPTKWVERMIQEGRADDAYVQRLRDLVQRVGFNTVALNSAIVNAHQDVYTLELAQGPITNQKSSGRCWIFAGLNMMRSSLIAEGKVGKGFEFSETYLHFFNMLEKSNRFLEKAIRQTYKNRRDVTKGELENLRNLLEPDVSDGGWFDYFQFLVSKYGVVPKNTMRETKSSEATTVLLRELNFHLSRATAEIFDQAVVIAKTAKKNGRQLTKQEFLSEIRVAKERAMVGVWKILATHLGDPPAKFDFRFVEASKKEGLAKVAPTTIKQYTPREFAQDFVKFDPADYVTVSAFPRREVNTVYERVNSGIGPAEAGQHPYNVRILNVTPERMEELTIAALEGGQAVWFGADIHKHVDHSTGIMHPEIFVRDPIYGMKEREQLVELDQAALVFFGQTSPNHAMLLTGFDRPNPNGPVVKFKNENSWGDAVGSKGVYHLYREWFHQNVFEVIVHKRFLSAEEKKLWNGKAVFIPYNEDLF